MTRAQLSSLLALGLVACHDPAPRCPSPGPPLEVIEAPPLARELLSEPADRAGRAGAGPLVVVAVGLASEGDKIGGFVSLPPGRCALVYARGSKGVLDLDLFGFADDGGALASDESSSANAGFLLCPPHAERAYFSARVASGAGLVAIGAHEVDLERGAEVALAVGARKSGEDSGRLESWPGLEAKVASHRRAIGSSWEDVRRFATVVDARAATRSTIGVEPGRCLDVLVVPSEDLSTLDVTIEDAAGRVIARAAPDGRDRSIVLCSELGDELTIAARPRGGSGVAAFVVGRSPKGAIAELSDATRVERVSQTVSADEARAELAKLLDPAWGKPTPAGAGEARVGSRTSLDLKLLAGCSRVDVVAGKPLGPVAAALWGSDGKLLAEAEGTLRATSYACGAARSARADVESRGRVGPFVVDVRTWKAAPAELVKRPLAAARLLDRVLGAEAGSPSVVEEARPVDLEAQSLHSSSFVVAQGACTEVVVALEAGSGLDLRLVDEATQKDVLARGARVASQRVCGGKTSRKVRLELRVDVGPAPALVLLRTVGEQG